MLRITLAPVQGLAGAAKAAKRPDSYADALAAAASKEVLGAGVKPTRLFFPDGSELDKDSWELVGDKDTIYVSAGQPSVPVTTPAAGPQPMMVAPVPVSFQAAAAARDEPGAWKERVKKIRKNTDVLAKTDIGLHIAGYCVGHLPFFVETMRSINNTAGNTAFVMFVFIPSTAIWSMGLIGGLLFNGSHLDGCLKEGSCGRTCGCCDTDYRSGEVKPNMCCAQVLTIVALVLHSIIAYVETWLVANFQSWVIAVLIVKNAMCITGEIVGVVGACMITQALKAPMPAVGVAQA